MSKGYLLLEMPDVNEGAVCEAGLRHSGFLPKKGK